MHLLQPLTNIFKKCNINYHLYADDSQLYSYCEITDLSDLISAAENCLKEVKEWRDINKLSLTIRKQNFYLYTHKGKKLIFPC